MELLRTRALPIEQLSRLAHWASAVWTATRGAGRHARVACRAPIRTRPIGIQLMPEPRSRTAISERCPVLSR